MIAGVAINARRYPNADTTLKKKVDQSTLLFLDPENLIIPVHAARVPLNMLEKRWTAKIHSPVANINARWAT